MSKPTAAAYEAAARARNAKWGYDKTLAVEHFDRVVEAAVNDPSLRVAVEVVMWALAYDVWALAYDAGVKQGRRDATEAIRRAGGIVLGAVAAELEETMS